VNHLIVCERDIMYINFSFLCLHCSLFTHQNFLVIMKKIRQLKSWVIFGTSDPGYICDILSYVFCFQSVLHPIL